MFVEIHADCNGRSADLLKCIANESTVANAGPQDDSRSTEITKNVVLKSYVFGILNVYCARNPRSLVASFKSPICLVCRETLLARFKPRRMLENNSPEVDVFYGSGRSAFESNQLHKLGRQSGKA